MLHAIMTKTTEAARKLAQELKARNNLGESWRAIADAFPRRPDGSQIVKAGTLNRIALTNGEWVPRDREILIALGLIQSRKPADQPEWLRRTKKAIRKMARDTKKAVIRNK